MKFLILIFCFFIIQLNAYSLNAESYCPQPPYNLSSDTISAVAKYSGVNFVTKQITEKLISKVLREELNTSFDVNLVPFSNNSLLNGKFQSLSVLGNNATKKGLYFSTISAQTLCGYNQIKYQDNELYLLENSVIKFSARMTENDLNKILNANEYTSFLKNFKLKANNYIFAEISNIQAKIQNDKLIFKIDTLLPSIFGITPQTFDITTGLNVENGKINLSNIKTKNQDFLILSWLFY